MLPGLTTLPQIELVAGCDPDEGARRKTAEKWAIPQTFADPAEMLAKTNPDLAIIASPPFTHPDLARLALEHNCHIFCEKPFMPTLAEADDIIAAAAARQRQVCVNNQYYQMPIFQRPQTMLDNGELGRVYHIQAWQHMYLLPHEEGGWKAALQPRRVLFEFGTHAIDLICRYFDAYPEAVTAQIAQVRPDVTADVCVMMRLDFPEQRAANLVFNRMSYAPLRYFEMRLDCEKAAVRTSLGGVARFDLGWNSERGRPRIRYSLTKGGEARLEKGGQSTLLTNQPDAAFGQATAAHLSAFAQAILDGTPPPTTAQHGREVLRAMLAGYESAEGDGELVRL
jgi:predicted dehydrogenase